MQCRVVKCLFIGYNSIPEAIVLYHYYLAPDSRAYSSVKARLAPVLDIFGVSDARE